MLKVKDMYIELGLTPYTNLSTYSKNFNRYIYNLNIYDLLYVPLFKLDLDGYDVESLFGRYMNNYLLKKNSYAGDLLYYDDALYGENDTIIEVVDKYNLDGNRSIITTIFDFDIENEMEQMSIGITSNNLSLEIYINDHEGIKMLSEYIYNSWYHLMWDI